MVRYNNSETLLISIVCEPLPKDFLVESKMERFSRVCSCILTLFPFLNSKGPPCVYLVWALLLPQSRLTNTTRLLQLLLFNLCLMIVKFYFYSEKRCDDNNIIYFFRYIHKQRKYYSPLCYVCMDVCLFFSLLYWKVTHRTHILELLYTHGNRLRWLNIIQVTNVIIITWTLNLITRFD